MSTAPTLTPATLDDLYKVEGKAELIAGRIVHYMAASELHGYISSEILFSLKLFERQSKLGRAYGDSVGFALTKPLPSGRLSFSPDAAFVLGPPQADRRKLVPGAPAFAVEVRSDDDYKPSGQRDMEIKRKDYFAAGTIIVWDVDPETKSISKYSAADPENPTIFRSGDTADAEPALPGWRVAVDSLFV
jgi:Uma2 family endonuclease